MMCRIYTLLLTFLTSSVFASNEEEVVPSSVSLAAQELYSAGSNHDEIILTEEDLAFMKKQQEQETTRRTLNKELDLLNRDLEKASPEAAGEILKRLDAMLAEGSEYAKITLKVGKCSSCYLLIRNKAVEKSKSR